MPNNIGLLLTKRAAITPNKEAFVEWERERRFTFAQLNERTNRIASVLVERGIKPGDRVATLLKNGIEFVESYFAIAKIGAVMVPVNWRLVPAEISYILQDAGAGVLIYDADFDDAVGQLQSGERGVLPCRHWLRCYNHDSTPPEWAGNYDSLIAGASPATITEYVLRHVVSTYVEWSNDLLTTEELRQVLKTHICLTLLGLTTGITKDRVTELLQNELSPERRPPT